MGRSYKIIRKGKFFGKSFDMNIAGAMLMGQVMSGLGLIKPRDLMDERAPHKITGELRNEICLLIDSAGFREKVIKVLQGIENRNAYSAGTIEEDADWVIEFLSMARNPEGFASDYCNDLWVS